MEPITYINNRVNALELSFYRSMLELKEELSRLEGNNAKVVNGSVAAPIAKPTKEVVADIRLLISDEAYRIRTAIKLLDKPTVKRLADMLGFSERTLYRKLRMNNIDFSEEKFDR